MQIKSLDADCKHLSFCSTEVSVTHPNKIKKEEKKKKTTGPSCKPFACPLAQPCESLNFFCLFFVLHCTSRIGREYYRINISQIKLLLVYITPELHINFLLKVKEIIVIKKIAI